MSEWGGEKSCDLTTESFEIGVVAIIHDVMDKSALLASAKYVIDCTGKIEGAVKF